MVRRASTIDSIVIILFFVLFNKAECKLGSGTHYSPQRLHSTGSSGAHGSTGGSQLQNSMHWSNSWLPSDLNTYYDYGT